MDKNHKDPDTIDLEAPRLAQYMHKAWKKHQNTVYSSTPTLLWREDWSSVRHDRTLSFFTKHSQLIVIPKVVRMETGEVMYEKVYASPRPPPKISLKHDWTKELGSEVARQPEGEVARQTKNSQPTQRNPNQDHDRTVRPVICLQRGAHRSQEIEIRSSREEAENHDRTGRPAVCTDHERSMLNEVDIDFRIPGLSHPVVKQADNYRVRELVKQIENHLHRQPLERDLQQNNAYNPFSEKSKKMIKDMGNVQLFELCETIPKTQCNGAPIVWNQGIVYCTCGHLMKESEANRGAIQCTLDLLSIKNYVIKKRRPHGHRYGKTTEQRDYHVCPIICERDASRGVLKGSTIVFLGDPEFLRASQLEHDRNE